MNIKRFFQQIKKLCYVFVLLFSLSLNSIFVPDVKEPRLTKDLRQLQGDLFSGAPSYFLGESATAQGYKITLNSFSTVENEFHLNITLSNQSERDIFLSEAFRLYSADNVLIIPNNINVGEILKKGSTKIYSLEFPIQARQVSVEDYRFVYMPFGYSGAVFVYYLIEHPKNVFASPETPEAIMPDSVYGTTGDPWKMLILIYPNINADYIDLNGVTKHLTTSMPVQDLQNMKNSFLNLPHRGIVYNYSDQAAELEANIVVIDRPLLSLEKINNGYWPGPSVTQPEVNQYLVDGNYDSVVVFWQASDPGTGQSIPDGGGWGWGGYWGNMTYASVYNLSWVWQTPNQACHGEVFLHEWLHGVTGFYSSKGVPFNIQDLHGAEQATGRDYVGLYNQSGCWDAWLKDYMRGLVYENGVRKALVPEISWYQGSLTTNTINGWRGEYFNNQTLSGIPVLVRDDPAISFEWLLDSPHPFILDDGFSARWTKKIYFEQGDYKFNLFRDDGIRLRIDGVTILEQWSTGQGWVSTTKNMTRGNHIVQVEAYEMDGYASAVFEYSKLLPGDFDKLVPSNTSSVQTLKPLFSWNKSNGAESYEYCLDTGPVDGICNSGWVSTGANNDIIAPNQLSDGSNYHWQVRAVNQNGSIEANDSWWSFWVELTTPSIPGNLAVSNITSNSITINWSDVQYESSYKIYKWGQNTTGIWDFYYYSSVNSNVLSFTDSNLSCNGSYWYEVSAFNSHGESVHAGWVIAETLECGSGGYLISGNSGVAGVTLSYTDGAVKTVTADGNGNYSITVPSSWGGTVTPYKSGYVFTPISRSYSNVQSNQTGQNYHARSAYTTGVFRPSNGLLYLKNQNTTGFADVAINYGTGGDYPVTGDWDGNGTATIGIYRNGSFYLRNSNTLGFADLVFAFGQPGDQPVAGDWNGDGTDTIGIFRPSTGQFLLRDSNSAGVADYSFYLGNVGDVGIAGDWTAKGFDTVGVFRPSNGIIFLKNTNQTGFADIALNYGLAGDQPVVGDWDGNGTDTIGVYRNAQFMLRNSNTIGFAEITFYLGNPGDMPIAGDWDGLP